jgi:glycosyltransferase involved in cell wall biosynthesis
LRVLVVSNLYPPIVRGGYEVMCAGTVEALQGEHDVTVLTSNLEAGSLAPEPGVQRALPWVELGPRGSLRAPLAALAGVRIARRAAAEARPDLVYIWNPANIPQAALRAIETSGAPVAYAANDYGFGGLYRSDQFMRHLAPGETGLRGVWARGVRAWNRLPPLRLELGATVDVAVSWTSEAIRRLAPPPATARPVLERVVYSAVPDAALLTSVERAPAPAPLVLFVGRLEGQKGPDVAIRALADLRERHGLSARLVCCGTGPMRRELDALASRLGVELELRGQVDARGIAQAMSTAHALVVPSQWDEPFGLVCLEGALARVPVVAARSGGIPEILNDEEDALLFERDDVAAFADALHRTLTRPEETAARVDRALDRADEFSWARYQAAQRAFVLAAREALSPAAPAPVAPPRPA